jgi:hypothetical protein
MPNRRLALAASLTALAFAGGQAGASPDDVAQAVAGYKAHLGAALSNGYWAGTFTEIDSSGQVVDTNDRPSCITDQDRGEFVGAMSGLTEVMQAMGSCTAAGGEEGTLDLDLTCGSDPARMLRFEARGAYRPGSAEFSIAMGAVEGDPPKSTMHVTMRKLSDTCPDGKSTS